jgi:hypothetical protein
MGSGSSSTGADNTYGEFRATANYLDKSGFGGQMDYVYLYDDQDFDLGGSYAISTTDIAGHAFYRGADWLVGGLAQRRTFYFESGDGYTLPLKVTAWGVEGQKQLGGNMSVYGQLGYQTLNYDYGSDFTGWIGSIEGRYFIHDNFVVNGKLTYGKADDTYNYCTGCTGTADHKNTVVEVGGEYRFANTNFSVFGKYVWTKEEYGYGYTEIGPPTYSGNWDSKLTNHQVMVGIKLNLGKDSLRQRDREGAGLNPMTLMKMYGGIT